MILNILMLCGTNLYNFLFIIINSLIITSQTLWKTKSLQKKLLYVVLPVNVSQYIEPIYILVL
mgnify:CR=1 FL=1